MTYEIDLSQLNPPQRRAVEHLDGPLLVLAGAGSGKTRVVTFRTARLLSLGVDPRRILVVTFTNKAAAEMRGRITQMMSRLQGPVEGREAGKALTMTTFHAFGVRLLRRYIHHLGYRKNFTILDMADQVRLIKGVFDELGLARTSVRPRDVLRLVSLAKRNQTSPAGLKEARFSPVLPQAQKVFKLYQNQLRAFNGVDFDDLLMLPLKLCAEVDEVDRRVGGWFKYVMVDEFQDTNAIQLQLLKTVARNGNLMAVGDDDQSIYGFQGALSDNIVSFEQYFPGAQIIKLEQNYRSTTTILKAANAVIAHNRVRHAKALWSALEGGEKIRWVSCADEREEAHFVADDIDEIHDRHGIPYDDFAVLYRVNTQAKLFEETFRLNQVPYRVIGSTELFDRSEVRDWVAYLTLLTNPNDDMRFRRIVNVPRRGLGSTSVGHLDTAAKRSGGSLWSILRRADSVDGLTDSARKGARELVAMVKKWKPRFENKVGAALVDVAEQYLTETGLVQYLRKTERSSAIATRRIQTLRQLIEGMSRPNHPVGLDTWLASIVLDAKDAHTKDEANATGVTMLTIHSSKGLEFPQVYLVGFEREFLPHRNSMKGPTGMAEERRLCYVGMTRAKRRLTLTAARTRTRRMERILRQPSDFLKEIPVELIDAEQHKQPLREAREARNQSYLDQIKAMLAKGEN